MLLAIIILTLAWSIGTVTQDVKTADYIISLLSDSISPRLLPVIVFLICALTSFSTGTSFGTMAIIMPIVIPLASGVSSLYNLPPYDQSVILYGVISSVLAGSVFGDHCSPISDTTILSSMASGCDHIDHVRTQLPYALVVGFVCMLIGDLPTAFGFSPYLSIIIITGILIAILFFVGKRTQKPNSKNLHSTD
jgi:Na+/H+ antiporter NhaC